MTVYFVLLICIIILIPIKIQPQKLKEIIYFILLWIIAGLRFGIGTDYFMYSTYFYEINNYSFKSLLLNNSFRIETGYVILNKLSGIFYNNSQVIFLVSSFIIIYLIIKSLIDYSLDYEYSIVLFIMLGYYHSSFNGVRQYIAIAIFIYSIRYIFSKQFIKYVICLAVAITFHSTAIFLLPIYFVSNKTYPKIILIIISCFCLVSTSVYNFILTKVIPIISPSYSNIYFNSKYFQQGIGGEVNSILIMLLFILIIFSLIYREILIKIDLKNNLYINILIISLLFRVLGTKSQLLFRMSLYFSIFTILLVPSIPKVFSPKYRIIIKYCLIIICLFCFYFMLLTRDQVVPYNINYDFIKSIIK